MRNPIINRAYSKSHKGLFATVSAVAFLFASAENLGTKEKVAAWQAQADVHSTKAMAATSIPALKEGLKKQYDLHRRWFSDNAHPQAEYVPSRLGSAVLIEFL